MAYPALALEKADKMYSSVWKAEKMVNRRLPVGEKTLKLGGFWWWAVGDSNSRPAD
jgi:hypothetical protein